MIGAVGSQKTGRIFMGKEELSRQDEFPVFIFEPNTFCVIVHHVSNPVIFICFLIDTPDYLESGCSTTFSSPCRIVLFLPESLSVFRLWQQWFRLQ